MGGWGAWLVWWKQPGLEGCQGLGHGSLHGRAVPVDSCAGKEGQFETVTSQFCSMGQGIGVEGHVLRIFWAGLVCRGCTLCWHNDSDKVVMDFKVVQSVFSSAFLEGWPVMGSDHQVHAWCLPLAVLYLVDCPSLLSFQGSDSFAFGAVWVPYRTALLQQWVDACLVSCLLGLSLWQTHHEVSAEQAQVSK